MKLRTLTLMLSMTGLLAACDQMPGGTSTATSSAAVAETAIDDKSPVVATVNGIAITENVVGLYEVQMRSRRTGAPIDRNMIIEEVVNLELASQSGVKSGLDKELTTQLKIDQQRRAVLATAAIQGYLDANPITDEELQKLYDEQVPKGSEYKARHILVEEEDQAKKLIVELDGGGDFSELAKQHSTGPSGKTGGELGWFSPKQMVEPFSTAIAGMEKGTYTKTPVKTQFGWHVIILDDVRETTPPAFDQVKPQLQTFVQQQRVKDYISGLRGNATVEIKQAPAPAAAEPAAPAAEPESEAAAETPAEPAGE